MSDEQAQPVADATTSVAAPEGQPSPVTQEPGGTPNDPAAFQADYTRKYQALSDERKAFEQERAQFLQQRQTPQYTPQYAPQPQTDYQQELVNQFGVDGAKAVMSTLGQTQQQFQAAQLQLAIQSESLMGMSKFGKENWEKHNYVDPMTGQTRNKVLDYRMMMDPMTGRTMTLDEAYRVASYNDPKTLEQQIRDKVYAELQQKQVSQPAAASQHTPTARAVGHAKTPREAAIQAMEDLGY